MRGESSLPVGLIFHTGRCGSTLLANILAAYSDLRVLNEPAIVNKLLMRAADGERLRILVSSFSRGLRPDQGVVVKTSSWNVLHAGRVLAALPGVPAVFVWRPAADVVASCLHTPPQWAGEGDLRAALTRLAAVPPDTGPIEFYARMWAATARAGLDLVRASGGRVRAVAYDDLRADPRRAGSEVARCFGSGRADPPAADLDRAVRVYSKDPAGRVAFDPGGAHARPPLPPRERDLVAGQADQVEAEIRSVSRHFQGGTEMPENSSTLRPEDVEVDTFQPAPSTFHYVDEDPTDPASGTDGYVQFANGRIVHI